MHTRVIISGARSLGSSSVLSDVRGGARLDVLSHEPVAGSSLLVLLDALKATDATRTLLVRGRLVGLGSGLGSGSECYGWS